MRVLQGELAHEGPEEAALRAMAAAARRCECTVRSKLSMVRSTIVDAMGEDMSSREGGWCVGRVEDFEELCVVPKE